MFKKINKFKSYLLFPFLLIAFLLFLPNKANAATLFLSPSTATVSVGNIISLKISTNTLGESINNAEATIQFPSDLLEVVSVSKSSSIFTLWVEEPSFSNPAGTVNFNGGVANPGFNGGSGSIASITFRAKKPGTASVIFTNAAVRKNDGLGTDILTSENPAVIKIGAVKEIDIPAVVDSKKEVVPSKPVIFSDTHPDQSVWYSLDTASFNWKIPSGVTSIQTLINENPSSVPNITYDSSVSQKTLSHLSDGIFYFHLRYYNSAGWGPSAHYQINIDTTAPLAFTPTVRVDNNQNLIKLNAEDATSGIDYYTVQIDNSQILKVKRIDLVNEEYSLPVLNQANHNIVVVAYDKAGNHTEADLEFRSSFLTSPTISLSSENIIKGESVVIFGKTDYSNNKVEITLNLDGKDIKKYTQATSSDGSFSLTTDKMTNVGLISIWAENVFGDNIRSQQSKKLYLKVDEPEAVKVTFALFWLILILILFIILLFILYEGWHKFFGLKKKVDDELEHTREDAHKAMLLLKEELNNQLDVLEKTKVDRVLNEKEEIVFKGIQKNVDDIDKFIEKRLNMSDEPLNNEQIAPFSPRQKEQVSGGSALPINTTSSEPANMPPRPLEFPRNADIPVSLNNDNPENNPISLPVPEEEIPLKPTDMQANPVSNVINNPQIEPIPETGTAQIPVNEPLDSEPEVKPEPLKSDTGI